jgi:hypothetical protein
VMSTQVAAILAPAADKKPRLPDDRLFNPNLLGSLFRLHGRARFRELIAFKQRGKIRSFGEPRAGLKLHSRSTNIPTIVPFWETLPRKAHTIVFDMDGPILDNEFIYRDAMVAAAGDGGH